MADARVYASRVIPGDESSPESKTQDLLDAMLPHDRKMDGMARRQAPILQNNLLGAFDGCSIYRQHLIDYAQQRVERRLDGVPTVNRT
jgi:hypothetical protein